MLRCAVVPLCLVLAAIPVAARAAAPLPRQQVDRIFAPWNQATPGCAVGIAQRGKPVLMRAFGMADLEHGVRNRADTVFEAGSVSKQFTAAAVALLARDGKLSLDDQARSYLPELPDYGAPLTIRQMLNHTSGLRDWGAHGGATAGYRSALDRYPTQQLSVAVLCNAANADAGAAVVALVRPASMPPLFAPDRSAGPAQAGAAELAELAGTYRSAEADAVYIVAVENGKLVARGRSGATLPLAGEAADRFRAGPVRVLFRRNAPGKVEGLSVAAERVWDMRFERQQ